MSLLFWLCTWDLLTITQNVEKINSHIPELYFHFHSSLHTLYVVSFQMFLPGVRRITERITKDITARITTMAIPMPFQLRGGPSELPRSWYGKHTHTYTVMNASTAEEGEDISAASFPQSHRNFSPTGTSVQWASGGLRPVVSFTEISLNYTNFPYENCVKLSHMRN